MYIYYFCIIFLTMKISSGDDVLKNNSTISNKLNQTSAQEINNKINLINNKTKIQMLSEGGSISPKDTPLMLPAENHTNLISLDKEIGKTKEKSIVARKGVVYNPQVNNATVSMDSRKDRIDTTVTKPKTINEKQQYSHQNNITKTSLQPNFNHTTASNNITKLNDTKKQLGHKKPLVLSYEALSDIKKNPQSGPEIMAKIESSSKSVVSDQLPTPRVVVHPMNANRHPGMVMPIVITILVVPVFAALGYMALRKGKEAWKNRHYKRVDFLLDGMYND